jgi:hypothetical protein
MKVIRLAAVAVFVFAARFAAAQDGFGPADQFNSVAPATTLAAPIVREVQAPNSLPTPTTVTPEMWFYSQERDRYDDPAQAVRRKAELRGALRTQRIASMKWFGMSNARPQASVTPMMGIYSPTWVGNGFDRYDWVSAEWPRSAVRVENYNYEIQR